MPVPAPPRLRPPRSPAALEPDHRSRCFDPACVFWQSYENDVDRDGKVDTVEVTLKMPLQAGETIQHASAMLFFDYALSDAISVEMEGAVYVDGSSPITGSQLWVAGQRRSVARSPTMRFNHTLPTGLQVQPGQLLSHYSNVSAIRAITYQHWTATICQVVSLDATKTKLPSQSLRRSTPGMPSRGRVTIWKTHLNI